MSLKKELKKLERSVEKEVREIEDWMIERKNFFVKLGWVAGILIVLIIVGHLFLR